MNSNPKRSKGEMGWRRTLLWVIPQCAMPFLVFGPLSSGGRLLPELILIGILVVLALLGYVQAIERCRERQIPREDPRANLAKNALTYFLVQALSAPLLWSMVAFARCATDIGV